MIRSDIATGLYIETHSQAAKYITRECLKSLRRLMRSLKTQLAEHSKTHPARYKLEDELRNVRREYRYELSCLTRLS